MARVCTDRRMRKNEWKDEDAWLMLSSRRLHEWQRYEGEPVDECREAVDEGVAHRQTVGRRCSGEAGRKVGCCCMCIVSLAGRLRGCFGGDVARGLRGRIGRGSGEMCRGRCRRSHGCRPRRPCRSHPRRGVRRSGAVEAQPAQQLR